MTELLLLPPIGNDAGCWRWLDAHDSRPNVYPGHGGRPRRSMTLAELADDAIEASGGMVDLLGVAMGGVIAQHILLRHPDRVRSAVLACTSGRSDSQALLNRAEAAEARGMAAVTPTTLGRWFTPKVLAQPDHPGVAYARASLLGMDPYALGDAWRALATHDTLDQVGSVQVPVTVVAGLRDTTTPVSRVESLRARIPNSRMELVPAPHMIHLEEADQLRAVLQRHLAWVGSRP
jgi:3-oxoadipate enol-lactonase